MSQKPNVTSPREIVMLFDRYGLHPLRQYGQNFLIDSNVVRKIVDAADISADDTIIEVGPGAGALTGAIAGVGADLFVIEIDSGLVNLLDDFYGHEDNVRIIEKDVLKINWTDFFKLFNIPATVKLISNLPYNISGPFMYNLFRASFPFSNAILMFQKEVADRLLAKPGEKNYGSLSVICSYYAEGRYLFDISKNVFWPKPKVSSAVINLHPKIHTVNAGEEKLFWQIVQAAFQQRRKTILNSLKENMPLSKEQIHLLLSEAAIDPGIRPEQLSVEQFALLSRITYNVLSKLS
ncbi:MAG: 16S rRNA (adenine(1518)-N(6)/adenine(1519)-N(6))-dimethyltransferase RsmA [Bacillota bacterium]|nr:16S rRNA (adenine(1518)-N(6)/adenine(1519)-N(6))-dimethyltransferase RsmA [Bacillota bacterium]